MANIKNSKCTKWGRKMESHWENIDWCPWEEPSFVL